MAQATNLAGAGTHINMHTHTAVRLKKTEIGTSASTNAPKELKNHFSNLSSLFKKKKGIKTIKETH